MVFKLSPSLKSAVSACGAGEKEVAQSPRSHSAWGDRGFSLLTNWRVVPIVVWETLYGYKHLCVVSWTWHSLFFSLNLFGLGLERNLGLQCMMQPQLLMKITVLMTNLWSHWLKQKISNSLQGFWGLFFKRMGYRINSNIFKKV